jgi:hypothetical protein
MNCRTTSDDIGNLDAVVPSILPVDMKHISNVYEPGIDPISTNIIPLPTNFNLLTTTAEIVENKVIDWNYIVNVYSSVHTHTDNIPDHDNDTDDDAYDYDFVDYFQDDPNSVIHTLDYDAARESNNYNNMNNNNYDDLHSEYDMDILASLF